MAAAVLGHAARRLGGGALRQTQEAAVSRLSSAVELGQRRLMPRFVHTEVQSPCTCGKFKKDGVLNGIQMQKEELYDALVEADKTYGKDYDIAIGMKMNRALLRELSDHVKRGPGDPTWNSAQFAKLKHDLLKATGFVTVVGGAGYLYCKTSSWVFRDRPKDD